MTALASKWADAPALQAICVPIVSCSPKARMYEAFANSFYLGNAEPVRFEIVIDSKARTAHALLDMLNAPKNTSLMRVAGRLSLIGVEALSDRNNTVEFSADLALRANGQLFGTGELAYYPPITSTRSSLP